MRTIKHANTLHLLQHFDKLLTRDAHEKTGNMKTEYSQGSESGSLRFCPSLELP